MKSSRLFSVKTFVFLVLGLWFVPQGLVCAAGGVSPDFNRDIRPILSDKCYYCHGPDDAHRKGKLRLDTAEGAAKVLGNKNAAKSELLHRVTSKDPDEVMPPPDGNIGKSLSAAEVELLKRWVESGAVYSKHWAFLPPERPRIATQPTERLHPIDALARRRLTEEKFSFNPPASKETLIRRMTLDLTGLPPTASEIAQFKTDTSPDATQKLIDRVLASPHYGERMALLWMDLARYGDSSVYHADGPREMWGWRDWVIGAFNANMPFDQFTIEQLAGDLIPKATLAQKVASGFNRNHATTDEGGVIAEEFRVDYVVDRVKTTSNVWLGLSLECAQCHDHKYDPISQTEYYRFYSFFNNTKDGGMQTRNGNAAPMVEIPDPEADVKLKLAQEAVNKALANLHAAGQPKLKGKVFSDWAAPKDIENAKPFPVEGVVMHIPCVESDKTILVSSLEGLNASTGGIALAKAERAGTSGLTLAGNVSAVFDGGPQLDGHSPFSFSVWLKIPAVSGSASILTRMKTDATYRGFDIGLENGKPGLHLVHQWNGSALKLYAKDPLQKDTWQHIVLTYDGSGKASGVHLFVNGDLWEMKVQADTLSASSETDAPLVFGGRQDGSRFRGDVSEVTLWKRELAVNEIKDAAQSYIQALRYYPVDLRTETQAKALAQAFLLGQDRSDATQRTAYAKALDAELKSRKGLSSVMVMEDLPEAQRRATFVLSRGQYDAPLKDREVKPGVPAILPPLSSEGEFDRLSLARWLVQPGHPLTARVTVNRIWQMLFGEGLVRTSEDFGMQGEMPSHSDLLDWLAVEFVESGWNLKHLIRQIVSSQTYGQDGRQTPQTLELDPENRLLARGPRIRLQAEFIRDNALAVSHLLNPKIGGPSVKPYQPAGVWEEVALDTNLSKFTPDTGEKLYRRSMYTYWKRSSPHPSMVTFDATTREKCTGRRSRTNTPLQALVTLNDPQFVEAARAFAQRVIRESGTSASDRVTFAIREALGREPRSREVEALSELARTEFERFQNEPEKARRLLSVGEHSRDKTIPEQEHATWMVIANTVLNLDEFLVK